MGSVFTFVACCDDICIGRIVTHNTIKCAISRAKFNFFLGMAHPLPIPPPHSWPSATSRLPLSTNPGSTTDLQGSQSLSTCTSEPAHCSGLNKTRWWRLSRVSVCSARSSLVRLPQREVLLTYLLLHYHSCCPTIIHAVFSAAIADERSQVTMRPLSSRQRYPHGQMRDVWQIGTDAESSGTVTRNFRRWFPAGI